MINLFDIAVAKKLSGGGGGGGGLEYEEGLFSPSEDIICPTISFSKAHSKPPGVVIMTILDKTTVVEQNTNAAFCLINYRDLFGEFKRQSSQTLYGYLYKSYRSTGSFVSGESLNIMTSAEISDYADGEGFKPSGSSSTYWRAGKTYKWLAVWPPE